MNQAFYEGMLIRIKGGQYTLDEINQAIDKAAGAGLFGEADTCAEIIAELKALSKECMDENYSGNAEPRAYDALQDIDIITNTESVLELYDIVMMLSDVLLPPIDTMSAVNAMSVMMRSSIGDLYVRMILLGRRTFAEVHLSKKEEVAETLILSGRQDLIQDMTYETPDYIAEQVMAGRYYLQDVPKEKRDAVDSILIEAGFEEIFPDEEKPILHYEGPRQIEIEKGDVFELPVVTASDNKDAELVVTCVIKNSANKVLQKINSEIADTYTLTYDTQDAAGNGARAIVITLVIKEKESENNDTTEVPEV